LLFKNRIQIKFSYLILILSCVRIWSGQTKDYEIGISCYKKGCDTLYVIQSVRHGFQFSIYIRLQKLFKSTFVSLFLIHVLHVYSNTTSFFHFVNKRASYPFGIISLAHAPVNATDFFIGRINCVRHFPQT
jgi:hypothetical protein